MSDFEAIGMQIKERNQKRFAGIAEDFATPSRVPIVRKAAREGFSAAC